MSTYVCPMSSLCLAFLGLIWFAPATARGQVESAGSTTVGGELAAADRTTVREFVESYCIECHNSSEATAGLDLESVIEDKLSVRTDEWEGVVRKLRGRQMPPPDALRPDDGHYESVLGLLESSLDKLALIRPQPGRTDTFRRLNRTEYHNAIRDLLSLDVDVSTMLPADESSHGFDNVTVGDLSPTLLSRYISAAQKISRLAVGGTSTSPGGKTFRMPPDVTQEEHVEGLPLGTRGGTVIRYTFPRDGIYEISIRLTRDRNEHVEGLREPHELELLMDSAHVQTFTVKPPTSEPDQEGWEQGTHVNVDRHLRTRIAVSAGPHDVGVTFLKNPSSLLETQRQPLNVHFNMYRHPRLGPAIFQVSIAGPFEQTGPGSTPSRERLFVCYPASEHEEDRCAQQILTALMRRAFRRPVQDGDLAVPFSLYQQARSSSDFESGIEMALSAVLVHPEFLFRVESDPEDVAPATPYVISDVELASRLSFFLWSSIPDDELLKLAEDGQLSNPEVLEAQTLRMLNDRRARSLVENFAGQWLYLRNLDSITPDARLFPDFDDNLRQAMRRETELFFESVVREDRSVSDLLKANYTFLNERLAKHYGIPHVFGSRFRRVSLPSDSRRGGLLRQASILTVTSYANRTSPVIRGKWILENILGTPPPPPPANVPALSDNTVSAKLSVRDRLAEHRSNPACASCHAMIDPPGFALENFDAVGRWRETELGAAVDATGGLPDGAHFVGVEGLEQGLLSRPEMFVTTLTEKLLTFALGRGVERSDAPAIRHIVQAAKRNEFRFSSIVLGIVKSTPFQMRTTQ